MSEPIFVAGAERSGTTLLKSLLDGHPDLAVFDPESRFFPWFRRETADGMDWPAKCLLVERTLLRNFRLGDGYGTNILRGVPIDAVLRTFRATVSAGPPGPDDLPEDPFLLRAAMNAYFNCTGQGEAGRRPVEKTPGTEHHVDEVLSWWSGAQFIHVVRDPRDHFFTLRERLQKNKETTLTPMGWLATWSRSVKAGHKNRARLGDDRYLFVRYEDLVNETVSTMRLVCGFLGIPFHRRVIEPTNANGRNQWGGNRLDRSKFAGVSRSSVGRWRLDANTTELQLVEAMTRNERVLLGYSDELAVNIVTSMRARLYRAAVGPRGFLSRHRPGRPQPILGKVAPDLGPDP